MKISLQTTQTTTKLCFKHKPIKIQKCSAKPETIIIKVQRISTDPATKTTWVDKFFNTKFGKILKKIYGFGTTYEELMGKF